jgi:hypothetical protein
MKPGGLGHGGQVGVVGVVQGLGPDGDHTNLIAR